MQTDKQTAGRPKDKPGDKEMRSKAKAEILAARKAYENKEAQLEQIQEEQCDELRRELNQYNQ